MEEYIRLLIQLMAVYKAILLGWSVKMTGPKQYELSKPYSKEIYDNIDLNEFIIQLVGI